MATQTSARTPARTRVTDYGAAERPARGATGWETFSWWFFRVTGVALIFLVIIHLIIMHVTTDVSATGYDFVAARYANPFWRAYDLLLLTLGLPHGLNGLRIICDDYIQTRVTRLTVQSVLFLIAIGFWLMGTMTIITFHPNQTFAQALLHLVGH